MSTQQYNNTYCQPQYFTEDYYSSVPSLSLPQPPALPLPPQPVTGPTFLSEPFHFNQLNHVPVFLPPSDCQETSWGPLPMFDVTQPPPSFPPAAGVTSSPFQSNDDDVTQFVNQFENIDWGDQKLVSTTPSSTSTTSIPVETLKLKQPPLRRRRKQQPPLLRPKKPQQPAVTTPTTTTITTSQTPTPLQEKSCNKTGTTGSESNAYEMAFTTIFNQEKNYDFKWEHNVQQMSSILNQQNVNQTLDITSALSVLFNCISNQREDIKSLRTAFCSLKKKLDNKNSNSLFEIKKNDAAAAFLNSVPTSTTKIAKRQRPSHSSTTKRRCPVFNVNQDTLNNVSTPAVVPLAPKKKKQYPKK
jgi:hypothetical protein